MAAANGDLTWGKILTLVSGVMISIITGVWFLSSNAARIEYVVSKLDESITELNTQMRIQNEFRIESQRDHQYYEHKLEDYEDRLKSLEGR